MQRTIYDTTSAQRLVSMATTNTVRALDFEAERFTRMSPAARCTLSVPVAHPPPRTVLLTQNPDTWRVERGCVLYHLSLVIICAY